MKRLVQIMAALLLFAGCGKEVPVTRDHPVSADWEGTEAAATLRLAWASSPETGTQLDAALKTSYADIILCLTDPSFEGGAEGWFASHTAQWPCRDNPLGITDNGRYLFAMAKEGIVPETIQAGSRQLIVLRKGKFAIALGNLSEADTAPLLQNTWFADTETDWIYALNLPDASPTLEDATFADCLYGQFGPVAMAGSRADYLYTAAGVWSLLRGMSREPLGTGALYHFTIRAEESRL